MAKRPVNRAPAVVRHLGEPQEARTLHGQMVHREEKLWVPDWGRFVACAPYDDHFIYESPDKSPGSPTYMCTCGSAAVVVGAPPKDMWVCMVHATMGKHVTSMVNLKDFPSIGGTTIGEPGDLDL